MKMRTGHQSMALAHRWMIRAILTLAWLCPAAAHAQIEVQSVSSSQADLGLIVSARTGDTIFRITPFDGSVTRQSGDGAHPNGGTARALVTMSCTGGGCDIAEDIITITAAGSTGRALTLTNFTVADGTNPPTITNQTGEAGTLSFTVSGIPDGETRDFYVGADFGVADSGATGTATASFTVAATSGAEGGTFQADVLRAISLDKLSNLSFGRIIPSTSQQTTVMMDAETGAFDPPGGGTVALDRLTPGFAQFDVTGEGARSLSIVVDSQFDLSMGEHSMTVTTNHNAISPTLDGAPGSEGSYSFRVGGSFTLPASAPAGLYTGHFAVTASYQ